MNVKHNRIEFHAIFKSRTVRDKEANTTKVYDCTGIIPCIVYGHSGVLKTERFGNVLAYEKRIKVADKYEKYKDDKGIMHYTIPDTDIDIVEGDAVCADMPVERHVNTEGIDPDYKIKAITAGRFLFLELEKL